ncbi:unnamed protein product, partial [Amoebophrya sp. A120]
GRWLRRCRRIHCCSGPRWSPSDGPKRRYQRSGGWHDDLDRWVFLFVWTTAHFSPA